MGENYIYLNGIRIAALGHNGYANFYLTDQVDSVKLVTDNDGTAITRFEYLPYGESWFIEGKQKTAPKYNSQELDKETGYYYYNARHYDPEIARFVTADSIIDGVYNTQGWNRYSYVQGNPVSYSDPTGRHVEKDSGSQKGDKKSETGGGKSKSDNKKSQKSEKKEKHEPKQPSTKTKPASPDNPAKDTIEGKLDKVNGTKPNPNPKPKEKTDPAPPETLGDYVSDYVGGVTDMIESYNNMKEENTKGSDKYHHCTGNCNASKRGNGGENAAEDVSKAREAIDKAIGPIKEMFGKPNTSTDSEKDMEANQYGRKRSHLDKSCEQACYDKFPYNRE